MWLRFRLTVKLRALRGSLLNRKKCRKEPSTASKFIGNSSLLVSVVALYNAAGLIN
jgi:hypothetical protein